MDGLLGYLYGVWSPSASDIYAVGDGNNSTTYMPLIYHNDGSGWTNVSPGLLHGWTEGFLHGLWGSSASDIYAVGWGNNGTADIPLIYHYDGSGWTASSPSLPSGFTTGYLNGSVWGSSASDIYAVGYGYNGNKCAFD